MLKVLIWDEKNGKIVGKVVRYKKGLVYMEKEEINIVKNSKDDKIISHNNLLWLIYRRLAEEIDISTFDNKPYIVIHTEDIDE